MSLTHSLKFASQRTEEQVLNSLLLSDVGLQPATYDEMKAEGLFGRVATISKVSQQGLQEDYALPANIAVIFDEDSDGDTEEGIRIVGRAVAFLLSEEKGDAMFFYVFDTPILKRANGIIQVTNEPEFDWLRNALDETGLKYELESVNNISNIQA